MEVTSNVYALDGVFIAVPQLSMRSDVTWNSLVLTYRWLCGHTGNLPLHLQPLQQEFWAKSNRDWVKNNVNNVGTWRHGIWQITSTGFKQHWSSLIKTIIDL